jgi:hypothetical protein
MFTLRPGQLRRRRFACFIIVAALAWFVFDGVLVVRAFISENRGIEFYRERPQLLFVCAAVAVATGLCVMAAVRCRGRIK